MRVDELAEMFRLSPVICDFMMRHHWEDAERAFDGVPVGLTEEGIRKNLAKTRRFRRSRAAFCGGGGGAAK